MKQIVLIHGGMTFKNQSDYLNYLKTTDITLEPRKKWHKEYLDKHLGKTHQIIRLEMPFKNNSKYNEWKIWFERYIPLLKNNVILIGWSLGGIFLAQYLSENKFPKKIHSTFLLCPPYDNSLPEEDLVNGFKLKSNLQLLEKQTKNLYIMFSEDDDVVPVSHAEKFKKKLPKAKIIIYKNKNGHFRVPTFPELVKIIKND